MIQDINENIPIEAVNIVTASVFEKYNLEYMTMTNIPKTENKQGK
jgi:hypothetical protein